MTSPKPVANRLGNRAGRRTRRMSTPKAELMDLCKELHAYGLGTWSIGGLLGHANESVRKMLRASECPRHTSTTIAQAIMAHLPADLAARCLRERTKSDVAHERAWNRVNAQLTVDRAGQ